MRPIEYRADVDFQQALRCVQYRIPKAAALKRSGMLMALTLRYGLVGAAAVHHLLQMAGDDEERLVLETATSWPLAVENHFRFEVAHRLPFEVDPNLAREIGRNAQHSIRVAVPLFRRLCPLEVCLSVAVDDFTLDYSPEIRSGWNFLLKGRADRAFRSEADASLGYAMNFFERRRHDLDEVPEIALLGE